jgi:hypothetical protein
MLSIEGSGGIAPMIIESHDFFDEDDFQRLSNPTFGYNPLQLFTGFAKQINSQKFSVFDLASAKGNLEKIKIAADFLSQKGMILYQSRTGAVYVKDKAMHFADAKEGKVDYDNFKILSYTGTTPNATISLSQGSMIVNGIEEFNLSDSLNVVIKPDSSVITFLQNRDIKFNGTINAGNFEITGKDFTIKYDSFFVSLNHIDSIRFYVTD